MPTYDFLCSACGGLQDEFMTISRAETEHPPCKACGAPTSKTWIAANCDYQICFKGEWDGKLERETKYRKKRSEEMAKKQRDHVMVPTLAPNVLGERTETWADAKVLAKDKGLDTSNYDSKVSSLAKGNA